MAAIYDPGLGVHGPPPPGEGIASGLANLPADSLVYFRGWGGGELEVGRKGGEG